MKQKTLEYAMVRVIGIFVMLCIVSGFGVGVSAQQPDTAGSAHQRMSLDVKETDIRDVIRMISKGYGLNIILDRDVTGTVTLHLSDVPIIEGLNTLASSNGWELAKEGSVYQIRKPVALKKSLIRYVHGKLTVDIQNEDVLDFLKEVSSKAAISIVPDNKITGKVSGKLYMVPLEDGLKAILEGNGFKVRKHKNIFRVYQEAGGASPEMGGQPFTSRRPRTAGPGEFQVECSDGYLSVDVMNGNLEDVVSAISEQCDFELIIYGDISGEVNARLNDLPLTEALALLLGGTKFTFVEKDNVLLIGDRNTATPAGQALSKSEMIHLSHIKADEVPKILPKNIPANNIKVIKEQNALLVSGTSEDIVQTREFLETIDIPTPQIVIDVIVVEYTRDLDRDFGLSISSNKQKSDGTGSELGSNYWNFPELEFNRTGVAAKKLLSDVFGNASFVTHLPDDFHMSLRLLETQKKAKVLAQPSITVLNGNKATINVGQTQYFKVTTGTEQNLRDDFRPINFGISLNITPWISRGGQITAEINPEISNSMGINEDGGYPNLFRRSVSTTVRIDDNKTLVLGGLLRADEQVTHRKVPLLGDIPILGYLFKSTKKVKVQTNLVIYITPKIVDKESYVDLQQELERFDINEKKGIFRKKATDEALEPFIERSSDTPKNNTAEKSTLPSDTLLEKSPRDTALHNQTGINGSEIKRHDVKKGGLTPDQTRQQNPPIQPGQQKTRPTVYKGRSPVPGPDQQPVMEEQAPVFNEQQPVNSGEQNNPTENVQSYDQNNYQNNEQNEYQNSEQNFNQNFDQTNQQPGDQNIVPSGESDEH